jgi:hypothetical protein
MHRCYLDDENMDDARGLASMLRGRIPARKHAHANFRSQTNYECGKYVDQVGPCDKTLGAGLVLQP